MLVILIPYVLIIVPVFGIRLIKMVITQIKVKAVAESAAAFLIPKIYDALLY